MAKKKKLEKVSKALMEAIWTCFANVVENMMTKQKFTDWYEKEFVPNMIEEQPSPTQRTEIMSELISMLKSADESLGEIFKKSLKKASD